MKSKIKKEPKKTGKKECSAPASKARRGIKQSVKKSKKGGY